MAHICVSKFIIIGSDNGLSPGRRQAIIWTNAGILLIRTSGTNFSEILSLIHTFSFKKIHLKMASAKWHPFCLGLNVLTAHSHTSSPAALSSLHPSLAASCTGAHLPTALFISMAWCKKRRNSSALAMELRLFLHWAINLSPPWYTFLTTLAVPTDHFSQPSQSPLTISHNPQSQGLSQPKIFTHRQWPLLKPNKTYRPAVPKKG